MSQHFARRGLTMADLGMSPPAKKASKMGNKPTTLDGKTFQSKAEAHRYAELCLLVRAGLIRGLQMQVRYELVRAVRFSDAKRVTPAMVYVADFVYEERRFHVNQPGRVPVEREDSWVTVVEDVKGMRTAVYKLKRHMMLALLGIEVREHTVK